MSSILAMKPAEVPIGLIAASSLFMYMLHVRVPARFSPTFGMPVDVGRVAVRLRGMPS